MLSTADAAASRSSKSRRRRRPTILGARYRVERYLDSGGTADIYLARDLWQDERVALKLLRRDAAHDAVLRRQFENGARAAMRVQHPNVVRLFHVSAPDEPVPYAGMELLSGRPLNQVLAGERALPAALAVEIVIQAASGLSAAHQAGVVHCDVKPENLFLLADAALRPSLKIIDFDLACVDGVQHSAEHELVGGTPKYMAPEQIVGDPVDARSDVYALGVVLFRLLTGHLPFDVPLGKALLDHQLYSPLPPASWLAEQVDPALEAIVARATRKQPDNRYPSMQALVEDLEAVRRGEVPSSAPLSVSPDHYSAKSDRGAQNLRKLARPAPWRF